MATSPDFVRVAATPARALTESILDALREAVIVVDARAKNLPLRLANSAARRCLLSDDSSRPPSDSSFASYSLYTFLGDTADALIQGALNAEAMGGGSSIRMLPWRFPRGEIPVLTQITVLESNPAEQLVMLSFAESPADAAAAVERAAAAEQSQHDLLILDPELTVTYANLGAARAAGGVETQGVLGFSALILVPTSAVPREAFVGALEGRRFVDDAIAVKSPGAPTRWFQVDIQPLRDGTGIVGLAVLSCELTEASIRSRAIRGGDRRLSVLTENASDIIKIASRDGNLQYVSGGVRNALGYSPEDRRSNSLFELVHPDDLDGLREHYSALVAGIHDCFRHVYRVRHRDGTYRWLEASFVSALGNPLIDGVVINARDITERRLAESRLAQREDVFRLAAEAVNGFVFEWDLALGSIQCSRGVQEVQSVEAWEERIHPLDLPAYQRTLSAALASEPGWTTQHRIRNAEGRYVAVLERARIQRDPTGKPVRAVGCSMDVSETQRLNELLNDTHRSAKTGGWEYRYDTRRLEWTDGMYRIFDAHPGEFKVTWHSMMSRCTSDSRQRLYEAIDRAEAGDGQISIELEVVTLREQRLWVRVVGCLEKINGRTVRAYGSMQNIQAQKVAQLSLQQSTEWLKLSMNMAHMHAWRWDREEDALEFAILDGRMVHLPRVFPGMKQLLARVHPKDRLAVRRCIDDAFERHRDVRQEFRLRSHDGRYRTYAAVARPLFDPADHATGLVGITQDVTTRHEAEARHIAERKRLEEEILNIASRERQTIGRDLHDGLGQELTAVALMLRALSTRVRGGAPQASGQMDEIVALVNQSIDSARDLARGLLPVNTDGGGLVSALSALADRCRDLYGFEASFEAEVSDALALNETKANHVYRIAQEAVSNAARHGNPRAVCIRLQVTDSTFLLSVSDDGTGLPASATAASGMGLRIMKHRADMINAKFEVVPNTPCGTVVRVLGRRAPPTVSMDGLE